MKNRYLNLPGKLFFCLAVIVCLLGFQGANAQEKITVSGSVTAQEDGMLIPGVSVMEKGTTNGTSTDFDGNYTLSVAKNATLVFSYIGFLTQEVPVEGKTTLNVVLKTDTQQLEEVVVVGYGTQKKALVTGANIQVSGDALQKQSTTNALQALQGQTPGVQISSTSGQPGEGLKVVIRGIGSTGGSNPLYIVDGVLTSDITYLNNSDIESISVLKDAASAAIYGSQASNGVVLVTTKKGKKGHSQITFDSYYGVQEVARKLDMASAREYAILINEAAINSGSNAVFTDEQIEQPAVNTNWLDKVFSTATTENYNLGITGGSDTSSYSSSMSYLNQEGIVGGSDLSDYSRFNFRFNSEHKLYKDRIIFGENISFAYTKKNGIGIGNVYNNSLRGAITANPWIPMYDADGNYYNTYADTNVPYLNGQANPYAAMLYGNQNENDSQKLLGNIYMQFELLKNLKFRTSLGLDYGASQGHSFTPIYQLSVYNFSNYTTVYQNMWKGKSLLWDNLLTYNLSLGDHNFEAMLGTSSYKYDGNYLNGSNINLVFDDLEHAWLSNATNTEGANITLKGGPDVVTKRMSYFGRLNYNYKETYLLYFTLRADGSTRFGPENRWGYFPSVSGGWVMSNESFMQNTSSWLNFLKVRASWGQVGNQNLGDFQYLAPITFNNVNYIFGNQEAVLTPGAYPSRLANPDIKWEASEQLDLGFDARFLNGALEFNFDWYRKTTKDWIIRVPVLATAGAEPPFINGGDAINTGVELALNYHGVINEDFSFNVAVNGAYNKNTVGNIPNGDGIIHGPTNQIWNNSPEFYRAENGHPLGYFWGYKTAGVFQTEAQVQSYTNSQGGMIQPNAEPGDLIYVDTNGDGAINQNDKTEIGNPNPDVTYGFSLSATYKAFDFSLQTNGVAGNQVVQVYRDPSGAYGNFPAQYLDRWHGPGSSNSVPRLTSDNRNYSNFSDFYVKDADFLRISNVTLGYDLTKSIKKENFFASQIRLYFSVLNLYTFTKYDGMDPEIGYGISDSEYSFSSGVDVGYYPRPRTYMVGLNVKF